MDTLSYVCFNMPQITHVTEYSIAQITDIWTCSTKYNDVSVICWCASISYFWLNVLLHTWKLATLYKLVSAVIWDLWLKVLLHISVIGVPDTVYKLVFLHITLPIECFLHTSQAWGCWPLCVSWWIFILDFWMNVFLHSPQAYVYDLSLNVLSHTLQTQGCWPLL